MTTTDTILLSDTRSGLLARISDVAKLNDLQKVFISWILPTDTSTALLSRIAAESAKRTGGERHYQHVAILGYAFVAGVLSPDQEAALGAGLQWLAGRKPFVEGSPAGFAADSVSILGFALGIKQSTDETSRPKIAAWIEELLKVSSGLRNVSEIGHCLLAAAWYVVSNDLSAHSEDSSVADVRTALRALNAMPRVSETECNSDDLGTLRMAKRVDSCEVDGVRAALRLRALDDISARTAIVSPRHIEAGDIAKMLRRIPAALRLWTWEDKPRTKKGTARKWHVDNEYHVQNMLWAILSPVFPDLVAEEYLPAVGQKQPRADIGIPSLGLIIEVKFMRSSATPQDIIGEIAEDSSLYRTAGSRYSTIVPFVWDDSRRTEEHDMMINGLKCLPGVYNAIIVPRPGFMDADCI